MKKQHAKELAAKDRKIADLKEKIHKLYKTQTAYAEALKEQLAAQEEEYRRNVKEMGAKSINLVR